MHNDARDSAHDFIVKLSPSMCVAVVASFTGEMAAQRFAYDAHRTADSDKSCCYPWFVCHDNTLNQQCMLTQVCPPPPMPPISPPLCIDDKIKETRVNRTTIHLPHTYPAFCMVSDVLFQGWDVSTLGNTLSRCVTQDPRVDASEASAIHPTHTNVCVCVDTRVHT